MLKYDIANFIILNFDIKGGALNPAVRSVEIPFFRRKEQIPIKNGRTEAAIFQSSKPLPMTEAHYRSALSSISCFTKSTKHLAAAVNPPFFQHRM